MKVLISILEIKFGICGFFKSYQCSSCNTSKHSDFSSNRNKRERVLEFLKRLTD